MGVPPDRAVPRRGLPDPLWLARTWRAVARPPARPREGLALRIDGIAARPLIGSIEPWLATRLADEGLPVRPRGAQSCIEVAGVGAVDAAFAAIATWLRANDLAGAWRDERLAVVDAAGAGVGAIERAAVRPLGIATHAVHLIATDRDRRVWVQQRAFDKSTDPGRWDTTVGGLVAAGESIAHTRVRETWEEAGLREADLAGVTGLGSLTVRRPTERGYMVEHIEVFEATLHDGREPVNQDGEVERFERLDVAALIERLHADAFTLEAAAILAAWLKRRVAAG